MAWCLLFASAAVGSFSCTSTRLDAIAIGEATPGNSSGGDSTSGGTSTTATGTGGTGASTGLAEAGSGTTVGLSDAARDVPVSGGIQPPLHTAGNQIVDANGKVVRFKGVNWYGLESRSFEPLGIWARTLDQFMADIAGHGFNTVRLPFSDELFSAGAHPKAAPTISGLDMLKQTVDAARNAGLMVVLVRHAGAAGQDSPPTGTCWNEPGTYAESAWESDWLMLANTFASDDNVVAFDLAKEPHDPAVWSGDGSVNDWYSAAKTVGNEILDIKRNVLIVVQGIQTSSDGHAYWNGGNLTDIAKLPLALNVPNRVVYSTADYSSCPTSQPWFVDNSTPTGRPADYPNNLPAVWDEFWGNLSKTQPVILSEFGSFLDHPECLQWFQEITSYLGSTARVGFFFSRLNSPGTSATLGGLLDDMTWSMWDQQRLNYLRPLLVSSP
jgi:endoglucanase